MSDMQYPLIAKLGEAYQLSRRREVTTEQIEVTAHANFVNLKSKHIEDCWRCFRGVKETHQLLAGGKESRRN